MRNVVIYARVSTEKEAQLDALGNQVEWYDDIIKTHKDWKLVRKYIDEGITGTSAKKRKAFLKMIDDAKIGDFDLIITREVSRFARNIVDAVQYARTFKNMGVEINFINDNIFTFDSDSEFKLGLYATFAQDESR